MRYKYRPVFDGNELIAFAYWTGEQVQHYYVKKSFFIQSLLDSHTPTVPNEHVIKSLNEITLKDYPPEVQAEVKQLRLGKEALTDDLPQLKRAKTNKELQEFINWFRRQANEAYGKHIKSSCNRG